MEHHHLPGDVRESEPSHQVTTCVDTSAVSVMNNGLHVQACFDTSAPNVARVYDYLLGGKDNYAADREIADELVRLVPGARAACSHNRKFLQRAVQFLAREEGIRQFVDIGTGLPTQGNVHEVAQVISPDARVLYVDYDPVVVAYAQALLANNSTVIAINRDLRNPREIIEHPATQALIDFSKPIALLLVAVLHFIQDSESPYEIVSYLRSVMPPGSYLVLSHITAEEVSEETAIRARQLYGRTRSGAVPRSRKEIERFFEGLELIEPGLVNVSSWRAEGSPFGGTRTLIYAGVGRKK